MKVFLNVIFIYFKISATTIRKAKINKLCLLALFVYSEDCYNNSNTLVHYLFGPHHTHHNRITSDRPIYVCFVYVCMHVCMMCILSY